ncbi:N-acetylglucosamine-6-phosphate deacetylase [Chitinimonas sp. BJB300]|uniref:N-acetylglucosamine-6-phosphate deacetylase n=1 Tax=Chitinimonas sp. BJB300 TaxID=1559339 RepID=UPI000C112F7F|nr:N-acetylglucosamine-6-phosphate deacetylase [Chitinimonas sp. BJB300]PHV12256.1 N-acetylglucosamine-6-phosphate deacetylase [Chitinimonas sp. BJB300]TSJ84767.1 N-acetylglucosamine-6-phosphate deacetylase [Chitinimonas sp. BJB300]
MHTLRGNILTPTGWQHGALHFSDKIGRIEALAADPADNNDDYLLPGFIDLHVHGGGGRDVMEGGDALDTISRTHARHGTTSILATTMTAPKQEIELALQGVKRAMAQRTPGGARVLGVHLEGPYINPGKLGAQPNFTRDGMLEEIAGFSEFAPLKVLTLAPEVNGHMALIGDLVTRGIRVQLGHTLGSYEDGVEAMQHGAISFTHLFNAMSGLHHREPGMVGAALAHAEYAELIPDLLHVHPGAIKAALRAIPKLYCVTDSTAAAGMPDGNYKLGRHTVTKCMGGVRLSDGTLAGSTLTLDEALRNLVGLGLPVDDAARRLSTYQAEMLDLDDRGVLKPDAQADIVVIDRNLRLKAVYVEGELVPA